jgi:hypothetical protein
MMSYNLYPNVSDTPQASAPAWDQLSQQPAYPVLTQDDVFDPPPPYVPPQQNYPWLSPQQVPQPVAQAPRLTQAIHTKTLELLAKADEQVAEILGRKPVAPPPFNPASQPATPASVVQPTVIPIVLGSNDHSWKMFNNETNIHHHYHEESSKEKDEANTRFWVGVVGTIMMLATAFFIGKAVANGEDAQEEHDSFDELSSRWNINRNFYDLAYQSTVDRIADKAGAIMKRREKSRMENMALLICTFVAGGVLLAGSLAASKALMAAGLVIGVGTAAFALYKLGYSYFSTRETKDAEAIDRALLEINGLNQQLVVYP